MIPDQSVSGYIDIYSEEMGFNVPTLEIDYSIPQNNPPTSDFSWSTDYLDVDFVDESYDNDGSIVDWLWDFGDNIGSSSEQNPIYSYLIGGTYSVTLTVTDDDGATDSETKSVTVTEAPPFNWTFMVYLDGDNDLETYAVNDFLELSSVGSTSDFDIVVQFDRISGYDNRYDDWTTTKRYLVTKGMTPDNSNAIMDIGEANMGDPQTLIDFVVWATENYTSDRYCLILWNHGNGWKRTLEPLLKGLCLDETNGDDYISTAELKSAMNTVKVNIGRNIDILGFDACLMGMIEIYFELNNTIDIVIGSEGTEYAGGWPFHDILSDLELNPYMSTTNFSKTVVTNYMDFYGYNTDLTMAAFNVSELTNILVPKVNIFSQKLKENVYNYYPQIFNARYETEFYHTADYKDLYDFTYEIKQKISGDSIKNSAQDVMDAINNSCIYEAHGNLKPDSHGLSIYWAEDEISYDSEYENIDFSGNTTWDEFLIAFFTDSFEIDNSSNQASWIKDDGIKQLHNFHNSSDQDWVKFNAIKNVTYIIKTLNLGPGSNTYLYLYDTDETTLINSDDDSGEGLGSLINWTCPINGVYYIMVKHCDTSIYGPKTYYNLSVIIQPSANFTYKPINPTTQDIIFFNSTTYDPYNNLVNWTWSFGDGNTSYIENTTHQYSDDGYYFITLNVTDKYGLTNETTKQIYISNVGPLADFEYFPAIPTDLEEVTFIDDSIDKDGHIIDWYWDFGDGYNSTEQNPTHQYADNGTYIVSLNVTDDDGDKNETTQHIIIRNVPPIANYTLKPYHPEINEPVEFMDTSVDLDGVIICWLWDFGDGNSSIEQNPQNNYSSLDSYLVTLNVTDDDGDSNETSMQIITKMKYIEEIEPGGETVDFMSEGDTNISINVTDSTNITFEIYSGNPSYENIPFNISAIDKYVNISVENISAIVWPIEIKIYYTKDDLINSGIEENQLLGIYYWNNTAEEWQLYNDTGVNTTYNQSGYEGYCWANAWHLTPLTIGGDSEPPSKVTDLTIINAKDGKLDLSWNPASDNIGVNHYRIYRDGVFLINKTSTSYRDTGLTNGHSYTYQVSAVDISGNEGEKSDSKSGIPTASSSNGGDGGGGGGTPFIPPAPQNIIPTADAGGPYYGFIDEEIEFDGSKSTDDGTITNYTWDFGDKTSGYGVKLTHAYANPGRYTVSLIVTDDLGAANQDKTVAEIAIPNRIPSAPVVDGSSDGTQNTDYSFTAVSTDEDNDTLQYHFDWGDGTKNITEFLPNGTVATQVHIWTSADVYTITVQAYDNKTTSGTSSYTVLIDSHIVEDIGYITDDDADGIYDMFHSENIDTDLGFEGGKYLIDTNGDGNWNHIYDPVEGLSIYKKEEKIEIPWIIIIGIIVVIVILSIIVVIFRKHK